MKFQPASTPPVVVLIDDDEVDLEINELSILRSGLPVCCKPFQSSFQAIDFLRSAHEEQCPPALMVLDLKMPGMTGFEVIQYLRDHGLHTFPIVILSSSSLHEDVFQAKQLGVLACYEKPIHLTDSCDLFRSILETYIFSPREVGPE